MAKAQAPAEAKSDAAQERKWKVERAADALMEAEKVRGDAGLLKDALAELKRRRKELSAALSKSTGPGANLMKGKADEE